MFVNFPQVPRTLKCLRHFINVASEHVEENLVVSYWTLKYAVQIANEILPNSQPPDCANLIFAITSWLDQTKHDCAGKESITSTKAAYEELCQYSLKLIQWAENEENLEQYNKKVVKAYYHSVIFIDSLKQFGPLTPELQEKRKFARWRTLHIHSCLKVGETPIHPDTIIHLTKEDEILNGFTEVVEEPENQNVLSEEKQDSVSVSSKSSTNDNKPSSLDNELKCDLAREIKNLNIDEKKDAEKYCKWAYSALIFDDVTTAITNIRKALDILKSLENPNQ